MRISISLFIFCCLHLTSLALPDTLDFGYYQKKYRDRSVVTLSHEVSVRYFFDPGNGELSAKSIHQLEVMALVDEAGQLELVQVPFTSFEDVGIKSARYYQLDTNGVRYSRENVKVKYVEVKDYYVEGIFYNDLKVKQFSPTVDVVAGSILKYTYEVTYKDLKFLNRMDPQLSNDPVEHYSLELIYPEQVNVEVLPYNIETSELVIDSSTSEGKTKVIYTLDSLMPLPSYSHAAPSAYIKPHFLVLTKGWNNGGTWHKVLSSLDDLYGWYNSLIKQLFPPDEFIRSLAAEIVAGKTDDVEKVKAVYGWVQQNINYVAFEDGLAGFKPEECSSVAAQRYGDCKGIANLLVNMLRVSGIEASHAWVGTRSLPYDYSIPSLVVDNHMICAIKLAGKWYFLDGTDKVTDWDMPSSHIQGKEALVAQDDSYLVLKVPETDAALNRLNVQVSVILNIPSGWSEATGSMDFSGIDYKDHLSWHNNRKLDERYKTPAILSDYYLGNFLANVDNAPMNEFSGEVKINGRFYGNMVKEGNRVLLFPDVSDDFNDNVDDTVNYPVYFDHKQIRNFVFEYKIPANARVKALPQPVVYRSKSGLFELQTSCELKGAVLKFSKVVRVNALFVPRQSLEEWREFIGELRKTEETYVEIVI